MYAVASNGQRPDELGSWLSDAIGWISDHAGAINEKAKQVGTVATTTEAVIEAAKRANAGLPPGSDLSQATPAAASVWAQRFTDELRKTATGQIATQSGILGASLFTPQTLLILAGIAGAVLLMRRRNPRGRRRRSYRRRSRR